MVRCRKLLIVSIFCVSSTIVVGQSAFTSYNKQVITDYKTKISKDSPCRALELIRKPRSKKKNEKSIYYFNLLSNDIENEEKLLKLAKKIYRYPQPDTLGLLIKTSFKFYLNTDFAGECSFISVNKTIVKKEVRLWHKSQFYCTDRSSDWNGFKMVNTEHLEKYIGKINGKLSIEQSLGSEATISNDTTYTDRLKDLETRMPGYILLPKSNDSFYLKKFEILSPLTDRIFFAPAYPQKDMLELVKERKIELLKDLLHSPNYTTQVSTMEALWYLSLKKVFQMDEATRAKVEKIKQSNYQMLAWYSFDSLRWVKYRELGMTDERIVEKFENYMKYDGLYKSPLSQ